MTSTRVGLILAALAAPFSAHFVSLHAHETSCGVSTYLPSWASSPHGLCFLCLCLLVFGSCVTVKDHILFVVAFVTMFLCRE